MRSLWCELGCITQDDLIAVYQKLESQSAFAVEEVLWTEMTYSCFQLRNCNSQVEMERAKYAVEKVFRLMPSMISKARERQKVTLYGQVGILVSGWRGFGPENLENDAKMM